MRQDNSKQVKKFDNFPCPVGMLHYTSGRNDFLKKSTDCDYPTLAPKSNGDTTPSREDFQKMIDEDLLDVLPGMLTHSSGRDGFSALVEREMPIITAHVNSEEDDFRLLECELEQ